MQIARAELAVAPLLTLSNFWQSLHGSLKPLRQGAVHRLSALFLCLMLVLSLGMGAVAHAAEGVACVDVTAASALDHSSGDADQVPADADKGYPHHHASCYGHNVAVPVAAGPAAPTRKRQVTLLAWRNETKVPIASATAFGTDQVAATRHFIQTGAAEGRTVNFDPLLYGATYADLARAIGDNSTALLQRSLRDGAAEQRATRGFDATAYLLTNPDLGNARLGAVGALHHWLQTGAQEGRSGDASFGREPTSHVLGATIAENFEVIGDRDWFSSVLSQGQSVEFDFHSSTVESVLQLFRSDGRLVATDAVGRPPRDQTLIFTADSADTYYLTVENSSSNMTGSYTVDFHVI